jgi:hypothetical protein
MEAAGFPVGTDFTLPVRPYGFSAIDILDLHSTRIGSFRLPWC